MFVVLRGGESVSGLLTAEEADEMRGREGERCQRGTDRPASPMLLLT